MARAKNPKTKALCRALESYPYQGTGFHDLAVLTPIFNFVLGPVPGEGPDCHFPNEFWFCLPIPARIRGVMYF